jgi:hypothetical protein
MAYLAQTATDLNDILTKANTFFSGQGWTVNKFEDDSSKYGGDVFTGKRLHIQKSLSSEAGNVTVYANLRSANNQNVYAYQGTSTNYRITGIALNCSRGYDGLQSWDTQPSRTNHYTTSSVAGSAHLRTTATIECRFFSNDSFGAIIMEGTDQWYGLIWGVTSLGVPFYACSGGQQTNWNTSNYAYSKSMLANQSTASSLRHIYGSALYKEETGKWTHVDSNGFAPGDEGEHSAPYAIYPEELIDRTPDTYTGNPVLAPTDFMTTYTTGAPFILMGNIPGVSLINMKNLQDGDEVTISSDVWSCYFVNNDATYGNDWGYALLK